MRVDRRRLVMVASAVLTLAIATTAAAGTLLSSSLPGAFGVRYLPDRAVVTYTVAEPGERGVAETFRLSVHLPEPVRWGFLDREPIAETDLRWHAEDGQAVLALPFGSHRLHLGWTGRPSLPPESAVVPVAAGGEVVGRLQARFQLDGMEATGDARVGPGIASLRLDTQGQLEPERVAFSAGSTIVKQWVRQDGSLVSDERLLIDESPGLSLHVSGYTLEGSPVRRVVFSDITPPTQVQKLTDEVPSGAILVEAEDFVDGGGTEVSVDPGSHVDTHGEACVFSFVGDGSWLQWTLDVPDEGRYDLYARISCGDVGSFRTIAVDGETPQGLELVEFPGTGGWGHADGEWWLVRITGAEGQAPPLQLSAGEHTLRVTGVLQRHLNFDYLALVPHP
ncbi:MAG: hypothetical protein U9R79_06900 [Armatimonadota bacterium]|nr:hypothetical protein [Armatimonadota bacterium]